MSGVPGRRTVLANLGTPVIPPLHRAGPPHPQVWRISGVGAEAVGQAGRFWPAARIRVGALGVVATDAPVEAVAVDQQAVLCAHDGRM